MTDILQPPDGDFEKNKRVFMDFFWSVFRRLPQKDVLTLTASSTTTVIQDKRVSTASHIFLQPLTANAGAVDYHIVCSREFFTITHPSTATTDRRFNYSIL